MCPACMTVAATLAAGVASTGGLAALLFATLRRRPLSIFHKRGDDHGTAENRDAR